MKSLRKSFTSREQHGHAAISGPLPAVSKPAPAIVPPQKVIRALAAHRPNGPTELGFQKGDFFYVIREVNEGGAWYEAHNPLSGARGLVPRALFDEFSKNIGKYVVFNCLLLLGFS
jgi:bud emergence protein 1